MIALMFLQWTNRHNLLGHQRSNVIRDDNGAAGFKVDLASVEKRHDPPYDAV